MSLYQKVSLISKKSIKNYKDPLSHISDRQEVHSTLAYGGRVGVFSGVDHVFEDISILSPSGISCTPRYSLYNYFSTL